MQRYSRSDCRSQPGLHAAIRKHGWDNFTKEIIAIAYTKAELDQLEVDCIKEHKSTNTNYGYNCTSGGTAGSPNAETRAKISQAKRNPSAETRARMSKPKSAETRAKMSAYRKGKPRSAETRARMSASAKIRWARLSVG